MRFKLRLCSPHGLYLIEMTNILGISAYYHDSAAALVRDGDIIAAPQEERFLRKKHDTRFPAAAIAYCVKEGGLYLAGIDSIAFYDKPLIKFERQLETCLAYAFKGFRSFLAAMPVWLKEKLFLKTTLTMSVANPSYAARRMPIAVSCAPRWIT